MQKAHNYLSENVSWYKKWHSTRYASLVHLFVLVAALVFFTQNIIQRASEVPSDTLTAKVVRDENGHPDNKGNIVGQAGDRILVKFKPSIGEVKRAAIFSDEKLKLKSKISGIDVDVINIDPNDTPDEVVQSVKAKYGDAIEFAEVDALYEPALIPNDPSYSAEWSKTLTGAPVAWDTTAGSSSVILGIADTGVDCSHPDLAANCVPGWNFYDNNSDASDVYGHGTSVAGVAASIGNNGRDSAGTAWNVKIMPLRISDTSGLAYASTIANAITYAADRGVKVINNSYAVVDQTGSGGSSMRAAADYLANNGGILVTSAGNSGVDTNVITNYPNFLVISASDANDNKYSWSSYGANVDLAAPGCTTTTARGGGTRSFCGTSSAAPEVSGLLSLMYSVNPNLTNQTARDALFSTALDLGAPGWDPYFGWGRIRADLAVQAATNTITPPPPVGDTTAPSTPTGLSVNNITASSANILWLFSTDNVGVAGYNLYRNGVKIWTGSTTGFVDTGVSASTTYNYSVSAYDAAGNTSLQSGTVSVTTPSAPLQINSFSVTNKTATTATITWTTNVLSSGSISFGTSRSSLTQQVSDSNSSSTTHNVTLSGLNKKTTYYYMVNAVANGSSVSSGVSSFKTNPR